MNVLFVNHTGRLAARDASTRARVAAPAGGLEPMVRDIGVPFDHISGVEASLRLHLSQTARGVLGMGRSVAQLAALIRAHDVDLVHANTIRSGLLAVATARLQRRPVVVHIRDCLPRSRMAYTVRAILAREADALVATSEHVSRRFLKGLALSRPAPVCVIGNPVDVERFAPSGTHSDGARSDSPILAVVGQITSWKGQDTAIRALPAVLSRFPNVQLQIVGEVKFASTRFHNRSYLNELQSLVEDLGLSRSVSFLGERTDMPEVLRRADAVLVPSIEEPFGRTVAEAMAIGTPVIATTVGGPAELIEHGVNGLLAPPSEPETWSRAICRLLEDPGFASRLAARATIDARARFDPTRIAREVHALHSEIIAGGVRSTPAPGRRPRRRSERPQRSRRLCSRSRH